jgi:NAD(P)-dependent dehydrogenase (short-subunit alcohol dehydrogenase family)
VTATRRPGSILVTGAGRGIGRATAELFLSRGWRVGMYDVDPDAVAEAAGGRAVHGVLDVRDADRWTAALQEFCGDGASTSWSTTPASWRRVRSRTRIPGPTGGWSTSTSPA